VGAPANWTVAWPALARAARAAQTDALRLPRIAARSAREWWPVLAGLLLMLASGMMAARLAVLHRSHNEELARTLEVVNTAQALTLAITEASSAQRGRVLTGDPIFAVAREAALAEVAPAMNRLEALTSDDLSQRPRIARLRLQLQERRAEIGFVAHLAETGRFEAARRRTPLARDQMNAIRHTMNAILAEERQRAASQRERAASSGRNAVRLIVASLVLAALLAGLAIDRLRRQAGELMRANRQVVALNQGLEARVAQRTASLAEANEEIQRFAYVVSHDLRSPLVNVMGFTSELDHAHAQVADLLSAVEERAPGLSTPAARTAIEQDMPEAIGFIRASTQRMDRLIKAILEMSRQGRRPLTPETLDLTAVVDGVVASARAAIADSGGAVRVGPLPTVETDRLAVEQIVANLLDNALKYARPGVAPEIAIAGDDDGVTARIHVADNGRGIAREDLERVFELFRRAGAQDRPGEGIGLASVRAIARRLGGAITVASEPGQGSRFTLSLPRFMPAALRMESAHGGD
jgi:signal transduction histidine kinase